jgi:uncharacterized protein (DUF305 family)
MKKISTTLTSALIIISGIIGIGIGYYLTSDYKQTMYEKTAMDLGRADLTLDLRYTNAMIAHHRGAILLAEQAGKQSQRADIKELSKKIIEGEPAAINELYIWKKNWYGDTKIAKDPRVANLGTYDERFDLRFLNAIIAHHEEGLVTTREASIKSSRTEILNNADEVTTFLNSTLKVFKDWRMNWYNI